MAKRPRNETARRALDKRRTRQLYVNQTHRCPICDIEIEKDTRRRIHKRSGLVMDMKCLSLVNYMCRFKGPLLDRAIELVQTNRLPGYVGCVDDDTEPDNKR